MKPCLGIGVEAGSAVTESPVDDVLQPGRHTNKKITIMDFNGPSYLSVPKIIPYRWYANKKRYEQVKSANSRTCGKYLRIHDAGCDQVELQIYMAYYFSHPSFVGFGFHPDCDD